MLARALTHLPKAHLTICMRDVLKILTCPIGGSSRLLKARSSRGPRKCRARARCASAPRGGRLRTRTRTHPRTRARTHRHAHTHARTHARTHAQGRTRAH
eukprot:2807948-Pleurochrysis_carterae.AAC.1